MPSPDDLEGLGLAAAAILTAVGGIIVAVTGWIKSRRELAQMRAQLEPSPAPEPPRMIQDKPATLYDVADETRALVATAIQMIGSLTQTDNRIEAWGRQEHARLDDRLDRHRTQIDDHEERLVALEGGKEETDE